MIKPPRVSIPFLILVLFLIVPVTLWAGPPIGRFNPDQDLFLPQFDSKTDVDDIQSIAAGGMDFSDTAETCWIFGFTLWGQFFMNIITGIRF